MTRRAPTYGPNGGVADMLDEAKWRSIRKT
jgi:hypothetical protein